MSKNIKKVISSAFLLSIFSIPVYAGEIAESNLDFLNKKISDDLISNQNSDTTPYITISSSDQSVKSNEQIMTEKSQNLLNNYNKLKEQSVNLYSTPRKEDKLNNARIEDDYENNELDLSKLNIHDRHDLGLLTKKKYRENDYDVEFAKEGKKNLNVDFDMLKIDELLTKIKNFSINTNEISELLKLWTKYKDKVNMALNSLSIRKLVNFKIFLINNCAKEGCNLDLKKKYESFLHTIGKLVGGKRHRFKNMEQKPIHLKKSK